MPLTMPLLASLAVPALATEVLDLCPGLRAHYPEVRRELDKIRNELLNGIVDMDGTNR